MCKTEKDVFSALRGEKIEEYLLRPEEVPCIETSDSVKLCKKPLVTVQMCTYNHEKYIKRAIESVLMQETDFEYELIIGEDCSQDKTRQICFDYQKKFPEKIRVLWWHRNVLKLGGNGRRCQSRWRGEFVAICEGDDYWTDPKKLQKQVDIMRRNPQVGFIYCGCKDINESLNWEGDYYGDSDFPIGLMSGREFIRRNVFGDERTNSLGMECYVRTVTSMVRVAVVQAAVRKISIMNWDLRLSDVPLWLSCASLSDVYYLPDQVAVYKQNANGACARYGTSIWKDNYLVRIYFFYRMYGDSHKPPYVLVDKYPRLFAESMLQLDRRREARKCVGVLLGSRRYRRIFISLQNFPRTLLLLSGLFSATTYRFVNAVNHFAWRVKTYISKKSWRIA